ncbi:flippase [Natronolimnohabitans innermongolicus]|uniref:Polysaccharide biosynthesis protein n=1 Tax=Natronolimnohabitans innermongolicus JCM 12255 TaxID=1227499 RepID=L9WGR9_9EURY|nr:flippase [Natronolimnohabitans innermongolicus]ELY48527.1 polysaccharide biosynthesis protein [Natronolimnohabitans innermongolicus JCM 12255]
MSEQSSSALGSLRSVADGASLHYIGTIVINLAGFLLTLVLTRTLGATIYGIYAYGTMVLQSVLTVANFGTDVSATRYLSANRDDTAYQNRILGLAYATTLGVSLAVAILLFVTAPTINAYTLDQPLFTPAMQVFAIALPFQALTYVVSSTFRGLEMAVGKTVVAVVGPVLQLLFVVIAVAIGYSVLGVAAAYATACLVAFSVVFWYVLKRTTLRPEFDFSRREALDFYDYSAPLTLSEAGNFLFKRIDVFMVGIFLAAADVGIYNVAVLLATVLAMPLVGINQLFPPVASRLHSKGAIDELESVYATVTRWSITASVILALPVVIYRTEVLALFGSEFVAGTTVVILFVAGQLFNAAAGPANDLLTMTNHQYLVMVNHLVFGGLNVVLNYIFILEFGLVGAALATASVLAVLNVLRVAQVWYLEGLFAYTAALWKPLAAASLAAVVMWFAGLYVDGLLLVAVGSVAGVVVYLASLYRLGLNERDRELAGEYLDIMG